MVDLPEIPSTPVRVDPAGAIDLPLAGRIQVTGMTLDQLKSVLVTRLARYITSPEITVNLTDSGSQPVSVIGEVNNPGVHQLSGSRRLLDVLSLSGGLKTDAGPKIIITREAQWGPLDLTNTRVDPASGDSVATISVDALLAADDPSNNIVLRPNDTISVPRADLVYVLGDVKRAGGFPLSSHPTISLLQALSLAEGLAPDHAARRARILRPVPGNDGTPREIPVDVEKIYNGKAPDVQLLANDVLFIPKSGAKVVSRRALDAAIGITTGLVIYR